MRNYSDWVDAFEAHFRARAYSGSHDLLHVRRVWQIALDLAEGEHSVDYVALAAMVYFHDYVEQSKDAFDKASALKLSAESAINALKLIGLSKEKLPKIEEAILAHSYSGGGSPRCIEGAILRDADRIDALGAVGVARLFYVSGKLNARLYSDSAPIPQSDARAPRDTQYALDHFFAKLAQLPQTMLTPKGRDLAFRRMEVVKAFVIQFASEIDATGEMAKQAAAELSKMDMTLARRRIVA